MNLLAELPSREWWLMSKLLWFAIGATHILFFTMDMNIMFTGIQTSFQFGVGEEFVGKKVNIESSDKCQIEAIRSYPMYLSIYFLCRYFKTNFAAFPLTTIFIPFHTYTVFFFTVSLNYMLKYMHAFVF